MFTIKEVAKKLNVTPQAVYKKINENKGELKTYLKHIKRNGKTVKAVNKTGLEIIKKHFNPEVNNSLKPHLEPHLKPLDDEKIDILQEKIEDLKEQLQSKDRQLETKDKQIQELNERLK